jgi:hypothetical protein
VLGVHRIAVVDDEADGKWGAMLPDLAPEILGIDLSPGSRGSRPEGRVERDVRSRAAEAVPRVLASSQADARARASPDSRPFEPVPTQR